MSCFLPPTKAWRSLTSKLHSHLRKLKRSKALHKASNQLNTLLRRRRSHRKKRKLRPHHDWQVHHHMGFAPVYVDELFHRPAAPTVVEHASSASCSTAAEVWWRGEVDARAEMFISKFREEMRMQRQRSIEKYNEMLARGL